MRRAIHHQHSRPNTIPYSFGTPVCAIILHREPTRVRRVSRLARPSTSRRQREGSYGSEEFAFVPEAQTNVGLPWPCGCVRPGDQINRNIPKGQTFQPGGRHRAAQVRYNADDFYTHGPSIRLMASLPGGPADTSVRHSELRPPAVDSLADISVAMPTANGPNSRAICGLWSAGITFPLFERWGAPSSFSNPI